VAASKGESIEFWGDIHFAGAISQPEITVAYDVDANAAAAQTQNSESIQFW